MTTSAREPGGDAVAPRESSRERALQGLTRLILMVFLVGLVGIGLITRLATLGDPDERMYRQLPTEDGYLMLTIARNLALGKGMSTADGTIPTNGTQPLQTFIDALVFFLVDGDRASGIRILIAWSTAIAVLTAVLIFAVGRLVGLSRMASGLAGALWFASPVTLSHTVNLLETGLYGLLSVAAVFLFARSGAWSATGWQLKRNLVLGSVLGLAFWARNDAIFLAGAVVLAHPLLALRDGTAAVARSVRHSAMVGATAAVVALPWVVHGALRFGSVVPVSGQAYLHAGSVDEKLHVLPVTLAEYVSLLLSFPFGRLQFHGPFAAGCAVFLAVVLGSAAVRYARGCPEPPVRALVISVVLYSAALVGFYVFLFDAPHFMRRYLFPISPYAAILWAAATAGAWRFLRTRLAGHVVLVLPIAILLAFYRMHGLPDRSWSRGSAFFHGLDWVQRNLTAEDWVGSFQSGTMGFFHDRTINLDGKVNPEVLAAIAAGRQEEYIVESRIDYLVDWASIIGPWSRAPVLRKHFAIVYANPERNTTVLARRRRGN